MRTLTISKSISTVVCLLLASFAANAQLEKEPVRAATMQEIINSKEYSFVATTAIPMSATTRQLTSYYALHIIGDSIICDLPYFGRAYTAPIDPSEAGIQFRTSKSDYTIINRKKGGWDITIVPKSVPNVLKLFLTVSNDGYASLQVTSADRQSISFDGYIQPKEK